MKPWTLREHIAHWIHQFAYKFAAADDQEILIRDANGDEVFSIAFEGGFVASGPMEPYTAHTREYSDEDDLVGTIWDW